MRENSIYSLDVFPTFQLGWFLRDEIFLPSLQVDDFEDALGRLRPLFNEASPVSWMMR